MKLEEVLQQRGLVNEAQIAAAAAEAARTNTPTAFVLISQGFVSEKDVYEAQRELVAAGAGAESPPVPPGVNKAPAAGHPGPAGPPAPTASFESQSTGPASPPPPPLSGVADFAPPPAGGEVSEGNGAPTSNGGAVATASPLDAPDFAAPLPGADGTFNATDLPMVEVEVEQEAEAEPEEELKEPNLADFLVAVIENGASDLHLTSGLPPMIRVHGELRRLRDYRLLEPKDLQELLYSMLTQKQREIFEENLELDISYSLPGQGRFRVNIFQQRDALGAVMRMIPFEIKSIDQLGVPDSVKEFAQLRRGLVLVTGITGSGKSTTLAALIDMINAERAEHIMTVEDPIEFLHKHKKAIVNQREVGADTKSFGKALKHVLRQDPDIILVGEMRDLETISTALTAAETGHLVFGTLHTQDAPQSIDRVIDVFPPHQQEQIRVQLAGTLAGVVSQQLLPTPNGKGRALAAEVLVVTPAVQNLIREGKTHQIYTSMQAGGKFGMQVMDQHLAELVKQGKVTYEMGLERSHHATEYNRLVGRA
jgi:twitching motility protein PilT